jgi:hypothetical protein
MTEPTKFENKTINVNFDVYLIKSKWTLLRIDDFLRKFEGEVGFLRIVLDKLGNETDRTIALLSPKLYNNLCDAGLNKTSENKISENKLSENKIGENEISKNEISKISEDTGFSVSKFILKQSSLPCEYKTKNLFIPVPLNYTENTIIKVLTEKLKHLADWNIISMNCWNIHIPIKSREFGKIKGCCFISFDESIAVENIAMVRILLTDTFWQCQKNRHKNDILRCFWAIDNKKKNEFFNHNTKLRKLNLLNDLTKNHLTFNIVKPYNI